MAKYKNYNWLEKMANESRRKYEKKIKDSRDAQANMEHQFANPCLLVDLEDVPEPIQQSEGDTGMVLRTTSFSNDDVLALIEKYAAKWSQFGTDLAEEPITITEDKRVIL